MSIIEYVRNSLSTISHSQEINGVVRVSTQCMYPSNTLVSVFVEGGKNTFIVTDNGGAIKELASNGIDLQTSYKSIDQFVKSQGAIYSCGIISSPQATLKELPAAIILVANLSKELATYLLGHAKIKRKRNFKELVHNFLSDKFERQRVKTMEFIGDSNKSHRFENVIILNNERKLIVDPVVKDHASINSRVVANIDIKSKNISGIEQRIIYDDEEESWSSVDINLLTLGAIVIPFSKADAALQRFTH